MVYMDVQLGHTNLTGEELQQFIRGRASRLGLNLKEYDVTHDKMSGVVKATLRVDADEIPVKEV